MLNYSIGVNAASKVIKRLYGHNKYSYISDDDDCMEAGYDEIQREEYVSRKIAREEDELEYKRMLARGENPDRY